ncbi:RidA family protein [Psychrobacter jeotgali]|uniref:RidA family protein n=1 Tax=Psychrobacter jeotgali TaxID=179010 RepID=UPI001917C075|nr:RidA family protein [Psychrobacter jeotgali]
MSRETINPTVMYDSLQYGFSHATKTQGKTVIHCAGQLAWDENEEIIGKGDLAAQTEQVFKNLATVLQEAGATSADVVRMRTYIVDLKPEDLEVVGKAISNFYGAIEPPANTLVGVQSLAMPDLLIEIEMTAIID